MRRVRKDLFKKTKGKCFYCGQQCGFLRKHAGKAHFATLDHVKPRSAGGKDSRKNLVLCCLECNKRKSSMPAMEFAVMIDQEQKAKREIREQKLREWDKHYKE